VRTRGGEDFSKDGMGAEGEKAKSELGLPAGGEKKPQGRPMNKAIGLTKKSEEPVRLFGPGKEETTEGKPKD